MSRGFIYRGKFRYKSSSLWDIDALNLHLHFSQRKLFDCLTVEVDISWIRPALVLRHFQWYSVRATQCWLSEFACDKAKKRNCFRKIPFFCDVI